MENDVEVRARLTISGLVGARRCVLADRPPYDYLGLFHISQYPVHLHQDPCELGQANLFEYCTTFPS